MVPNILRVFFLIFVALVAARFMNSSVCPTWFPQNWVIPLFLLVGIAILAFDILLPRKSLASLSGVLFGLIAGLLVAYGLSLIVDLIIVPSEFRDEKQINEIKNLVKLGAGVICCYFVISFIIQTKDDFRFIIPYVEFTKQKKGGRPVILDTSVIIDGRVSDIAETRIIENELIVPRFVLHELQTVADSADKLKRNRGRRGLDMLNRMQSNKKIDLKIVDVEFAAEEQAEGVDQKLVLLAQQINGRVMTNDFNLNKVAQLRGVEVININDLANALKPVFLPGERLRVKIVKPGEEPDQGIGYLEDGTMVVAGGGRPHIGEELELTVTSVLQTSAGRMVFGRAEDVAPERKRTS